MILSKLWKIAIVVSVLLVGCGYVEDEVSSSTFPTVTQSENEFVPRMIPASADQISVVKKYYRENSDVKNQLAKLTDSIEFEFDSTQLYEYEEDVFLAFTKQKGVKDYLLLTWFDDDVLVKKGVILKFKDLGEGDATLSLFMLDGTAVGCMYVEDNLMSYSETYITPDEDNYVILGWWGVFEDCIFSRSTGEIVLIGAALNLGQEAAIGALLGCSAAATVITW